MSELGSFNNRAQNWARAWAWIVLLNYANDGMFSYFQFSIPNLDYFWVLYNSSTATKQREKESFELFQLNHVMKQFC